MGFFKGRELSRRELLQKAGKARSKKRVKKAIQLYKELLEKNPDDIEAHAKIAPLLARRKEKKAAVESFDKAAEGYLEKGFTDKTIAVYKQAARSFPQEIDLWLRIGQIYYEHHKKQDAINILIEGSGNFHKKKFRPKAISLLKLAFKIAPWELKSTLPLASMLSKNGQHQEALKMLITLAERTPKQHQRKLRTKILFLSPSPLNIWNWIKALVVR